MAERSQLVKDAKMYQQYKPSAFISYARKDAKEFARKLYQDLLNRGVDAWLDLKDMPSGDTFITELGRAIQQRDYFILVFTPNALESEYCRAEWAKAIEYYKPIIPVLRIGDYDDLPDQSYIKLNDAPNFSQDEDYEGALTKLANQLQNPPRPAGNLLGDIFSVIDPNYVTRSEAEQEIRYQLTGHKTTVNENFPGVVGLYGMGGVGKTALTMALAHDYFIRRTFSDGVFLLNMGDLDEAGAIAYKWAQFSDFLDKPRQFKRLDDARAFFQRETADKELLLILDDVWDSEYIEGFTRLGKNCRLLITTRNFDVLPNNSFAYQLTEMDEEQAIELIAKSSALKPENLPNVAHEIIDFCGRLPLVLSLIGAKLRTEGFAERSEAWEDLFNALQNVEYVQIAARTDYTDYTKRPNLYKAIEISVRDLESNIWEKYLDFAVFRSDMNVSLDVLYTIWRPIPEKDVRKIVSELVNRSLLQKIGTDYRVHDILLAYIRQASEDITQKHNHLLDQYNPNHLAWHEITDDGYIYDNLIYHLVHASRRQQVMDLFSSPHWLNKRAVDEIPYYHKYLNDIQKAKEAYTTSDIMDIPACVTLSFIERSVRSVFDEIPKELPEFLIVMKNDIEKVIIPLALMQSYRGKQVEYLEEIGKNLLSIGDYKNAERTFLLAADTLLGMSNSEIMSETSADQLWHVQSLFVTTGCALARFGKTDQRIFARLQEISEVKSDVGEYRGVLYRGAIDIAEEFANSGYLTQSLETLDLALKHMPPDSHLDLLSAKTYHLREITEQLINGGHFTQAESQITELCRKGEDTFELWTKYLRELNEKREWEHFKSVWSKVIEIYPSRIQEIKREIHSFRAVMDVEQILIASHSDVQEKQQSREKSEEYYELLECYKIFFATSFDLHLKQGLFTGALQNLKQLSDLDHAADTVDAKYSNLERWTYLQEKSAFKLVRIEASKSSLGRYTQKIIPSLMTSHYSHNLILSLLLQVRFDVLRELAKLSYVYSSESSAIQELLQLEQVKTWDDFRELSLNESDDHRSREVQKVAYSYFVFNYLHTEKSAPSEESILGKIKEGKRDVFVSYAQGVAIREGIEKALTLLNDFFEDQQEWQKVQAGFSLVEPFILLRSPEEAEAVLNKCFELIWDKAPGRNLLTSLFWRLSTQLQAEELAARMDKYIKRDLYGLKEVVGFAKDMLFLDEGYSRNLIIALLRLQISKPLLGRYSSDLFSENSGRPDLELEPAVVEQLENKLGIQINPEAVRLFYRIEDMLNLLNNLAQPLFHTFDFSHLIIVNQGKLTVSMQEFEPDVPPAAVVTDLFSMLDKLIVEADKNELENQYQFFPLYVLVGNLWAHNYPQIHETLISKLMEFSENALPRMQFDEELSILIFAQYLGLVSNTVSGQKALQILDHYLQYLNDNPPERDTFFSRSNMLPYILVAAPIGKEREELLRTHLPEIDHLNILLEMFAYFDADGDINAANIVMSVLVEKSATTDISLPPTPDWSNGSSWGAL